MKKLGDKFFLTERYISTDPFSYLPDEEDASSSATNQSDGFGKTLGNNSASDQSSGSGYLRVDSSDDYPVAEGACTVPHVGPIEAKILQGTDGRYYMMEFMRLTPRDANYVKVSVLNKLTKLAPIFIKIKRHFMQFSLRRVRKERKRLTMRTSRKPSKRACLPPMCFAQSYCLSIDSAC